MSKKFNLVPLKHVSLLKSYRDLKMQLNVRNHLKKISANENIKIGQNQLKRIKRSKKCVPKCIKSLRTYG